MISYCHENNSFCDELLKYLLKLNDKFEIWIDRTHCEGIIDLWESIANGMERSSLILCLLSNQYFQSKSCRQEFIYATDSLKRTIVPILIEHFQPKGWMGLFFLLFLLLNSISFFLKGIRMTGMKYIRFKDIRQLDENKINELINTILSSISSSKPNEIQDYSHSIPTTKTILLSTNPINEEQRSNDENLDKWFNENRISKEVRLLFDFQSLDELMDYGQLLIKDPEKQMNIYSRIYSQTFYGNDLPPHQFNRFAIQLQKLLKEQRPSSSSITSNQSKICSIS